MRYQLATYFKTEEEARAAFAYHSAHSHEFGELWGLSPTEPAKGFREHFALGIRYGYPICCSFRFALGLQRPQGAKRGYCVKKRKDSFDGVFVPCGIFHKGDRE